MPFWLFVIGLYPQTRRAVLNQPTTSPMGGHGGHVQMARDDEQSVVERGHEMVVVLSREQGVQSGSARESLRKLFYAQRSLRSFQRSSKARISLGELEEVSVQELVGEWAGE